MYITSSLILSINTRDVPMTMEADYYLPEEMCKIEKRHELHASKVYFSLLKLIISAVISTCNKSNSNIGLDTFISFHKEKFNSWCMGFSGLKIFSETARCIERVPG